MPIACAGYRFGGGGLDDLVSKSDTTKFQSGDNWLLPQVPAPALLSNPPLLIWALQPPQQWEEAEACAPLLCVCFSRVVWAHVYQLAAAAMLRLHMPPKHIRKKTNIVQG